MARGGGELRKNVPIQRTVFVRYDQNRSGVSERQEEVI